MKRNQNHRVLSVRVLLVAVVAFTVFHIASLQMQISDLQRQSKELDRQISWQQQENSDLKESLDEGATDELIAQIARDTLGYASPGERVFIDSSEQ